MWTAPRTWVTGELVTGSLLNTHLRDNLNSVLPIGTYILRAANYATVETAVEGRWLQCNGVAVSRSTYSDLFSYLNGLTPALPFGTGDGVTTFTLPDLRGRAAFAEGEHTEMDAMGDSDGVAIANRSASHSHLLRSHNETGFSQWLTRQAFNGGAAPPFGYPTSGNPNLLDKPAYLVAGSYFIKYTV